MAITRKKVAIEAALTPYLSPAKLLEVLRLWEEKYALQPTFALQRFVNEFCQGGTLRAQRSQILQSLVLALSGVDGRPLDKPMVTPRAPADANHAPLQCCAALLETLFARLPGDTHVRLRLYILDHLRLMKLPTGTQRALQAWLSQQYRIPADIGMDEAALRHLVNLAYVALCELLGPVKADRLLHEAVESMEQREGAFPVRRLL